MSTTTVQLELDDTIVFELMKMAHEQDITLNQLINNILREYLERADFQESPQLNYQ